MSDPHPMAGDGEVLGGLELIRRRPGMYVGDLTNGYGLWSLFGEALDHSVDAHLDQGAQHIEVELHDDGAMTVADDGPGFLTGSTPNGLSHLERMLTRTYRFDSSTPLHGTVATGSVGPGLIILNALSARLEVTIHRDGQLWRQSYRDGRPLAPLAAVDTSSRTGTRLTFWPDPSIFTGVRRLDPAVVARRLRDLAALFPGLTLELRHDGQHSRFHAPAGMSSLVADACGGRPTLLPDIARFDVTDPCEDGEPGEMHIKVALQWLAAGEGERSYFANGIRLNGGTPARGSQAGMMQAIRRHAQARGRYDRTTWRDVSSSITHRTMLAVQVGHPRTVYHSRTKEILANPDVGRLLRRTLSRGVYTLLADHPEVLDTLLSAPATVGAPLSTKLERGRG
ncbi:MAG: hypothetical protein EOO74_07080 [Myxococcales bacterium]|nr:MAG: hypothetical protein EOO74_07080 [Myxococcales bacterium]